MRCGPAVGGGGGVGVGLGLLLFGKNIPSPPTLPPHRAPQAQLSPSRSEVCVACRTQSSRGVGVPDP